ncbi:hypothetical protein G7062_00375 [Erysipelothrix sp. HDW6C]|uniref:hypothetical protein n=1 Tax=Erysipelothrix sp. HDW6C TaxID=2714930 RepID=UPI0014074427|nr:hypothetical protein [Erysipelothrix sp. HDW6C]QIK68830.1 hypothetical protein G7062_00375 [Erysipelothrix sp. HDW6C]
MNNIINYRKKRATRILFITAFIVVALLFVFGKQTAQVYRSVRYIQAPTVTTIEELEEALYTKGAAKLNVEYLDDTSIYYGSDNKAEYSYAISFLEESFIVVLEEGRGEDMRTFEEPGTIIVTLPTGFNHDQARERIIEDYAEYFEMTEEDVEPYFFSNVVRLEGIRPNVYPVIFLSLGVLTIGIAAYFWMSHRAYHDLEKNFTSDDMNQIDEEMANPILELNNVVLTPTFLIDKKTLSVGKQFIRIENIAWIYMHVQRTKTYGVTTSTVYSLAVMVDGSRNPIKIVMTEDNVYRMMGELLALNPNIVPGFQQPWVKVWKKHPRVDMFRQTLENDFGLPATISEGEFESSEEETITKEASTDENEISEDTEQNREGQE